MCDQNTYELRLKHCPCGCGYKVTARVADIATQSAPCPRCGGSTVAEFRDSEFVPVAVQVAGMGHVMNA